MIANEEAMKWFRTHVERQEDCILWTGALGGALNYGTFAWYVNGVKYQHPAHKVAWEYENGPIPEGMNLHHKCENKLCVNPDHIEPLTYLDHMRLHRGRITHCKHGHPFDEVNTYINTRGQRECKECRRAATRKHRIVHHGYKDKWNLTSD